MILVALKLRNGSIFLLNNLIVKTVDFMGNGLLTVKDSKGVIWTGVNSFCRGIGLNKNERNRQVKNVKPDKVLKRGCIKFAAGVFEPNNETIALQLDCSLVAYLNLYYTKHERN